MPRKCAHWENLPPSHCPAYAKIKQAEMFNTHAEANATWKNTAE